MSTVNERISKLLSLMEERKIDYYVIPTADFHESEYVGEYFKARKFMTGFTGSAGIAVVGKKESGLWTDGRYFVQAAAQLKNSFVKLFKQGEKGVPTIDAYLKENLPEGGCIGFDGRVVNDAWGRSLKEIALEKHGSLHTDEDLVDLVWTDRPAMSKEPLRIVSEKFSGKSTGEKISDVRAAMEKKGADWHLLTSLYDIAWLLNVRGNDIHCVPVVLSFVAMSRDRLIWFVQEEILTETDRKYLADNRIETKAYGEFYDFVAELPAGSRVLMNRSLSNYRVCSQIPENVTILDDSNPEELMKSMKNPVEVENARIAHRKDAAAMIRFHFWLKENVGKIPMTEISVSDYLENLRSKEEGFIGISFDTISAYAENGAMCHYKAEEGSCKTIRPEGLLLVDSGGHYLEGSTDITRTYACGPITEKMRSFYTRVLRANLALADAKFRYGCTGINLDYLARAPFWEINMDFNHGTGHGVGNLLNIHEGPQGFRWRSMPGKREAAIFEEGMITSDEPGIYLEGEFGIRIENELVCRTGIENEYGRFMYFETLTYVPIDLDCVDVDALSEKERKLLNDYHRLVLDTMLPYMTEEEKPMLEKACRAV